MTLQGGAARESGMRTKLRLWLATMVLMFAPLMVAQRNRPPDTPKMQPQPGDQTGMKPTIQLAPLGSSDEPAALRQTRAARNAMRQKQLVEKTQQLQKLTDELKAKIDAGDNDTLSVDCVKKSEQIEKLAKSIHSLILTPL